MYGLSYSDISSSKRAPDSQTSQLATHIVSIKTDDQPDMHLLHRMRVCLVMRRTAVLSQCRWILVEFVALYNRAWRLEKLGGRTPWETRQAWFARQAARC